MRVTSVSPLRHREYVEDVKAGLVEGQDFCVGCPVDHFCCREELPVWTLAEAKAVMDRYESLEIPEKAPCQFLVNDKCSIYDIRPFDCRTGMCSYSFTLYKRWKTQKDPKLGE